MSEQTNPQNPPGDSTPGTPDIDQSALQGDPAAVAQAPSAEAAEITPSDLDALMQGLPSSEAPNEKGVPVDEEGPSEEAAGSLDTMAESADGPIPKFEANRFDFPDLSNASADAVDAHRVSMLHDVNLRVRVELGRTKMRVEEVLKLGEGSIVELEKLAGDPVDVYVNDRLLARGEVLVLNDSFCVRVSEVFTPDPHRVLQ